MKKIIKLFTVFFKIGLFTFGGGYAMIPFIAREIAEKNKWLKEEEILDVFVIAQSTPGVIAVNSATFVGYRIAGFAGATAATLGVVLPSLIVILLVYFFLMPYRDSKWVGFAFEGSRFGVIVLVADAAVKLNKANPKNVFNLLLICLVIILTLLFNINSILILIGALAAGMVYFLYIKKEELDSKKL